MHLNIIKTIDQFEALADEWNHLLKGSASHVPFLRHEYLRAWWNTLGGGEWRQGELCLVTARHEDGRLIGIAPLFYTRNREGREALLLMGSIEISDYLDFICRPEDFPAFINALLLRLAEPDLPAWQVLDLYNVLDHSPT